MILIKLLTGLILFLTIVTPFGCSEDFPCFLYPVYAVGSGSEASYAQTSTPSSSLKEKIKALDAEIASRAAQLLPSINKRLRNKAYVGFIKSKSSTSLTLATKSGSYIVNLNDYTVYEGRAVSLTTLAVDDYVAALGDVDDTDVLTAKKIVRFATPSKVERQIFGGTVTAVTGQTLTLRSFEGHMKTINLSAQTNYRFGSEDADLSAVKVNKAVYVVGLSAENKLTGRLVYIVPYTLTLPKSKTATASASPSSSSVPKKP